MVGAVQTEVSEAVAMREDQGCFVAVLLRVGAAVVRFACFHGESLVTGTGEGAGQVVTLVRATAENFAFIDIWKA